MGNRKVRRPTVALVPAPAENEVAAVVTAAITAMTTAKLIREKFRFRMIHDARSLFASCGQVNTKDRVAVVNGEA